MGVTGWRTPILNGLRQDCLSSPPDVPIRLYFGLAEIKVQNNVSASSTHLFDPSVPIVSPVDVTQCLVARSFGFDTLGLPGTDVIMGVEFRARIRTVINDPDLLVSDFMIRALLGLQEIGANLARPVSTTWPESSFVTVTWGDVNKDYAWGVDAPTVAGTDFAQFGWVISTQSNITGKVSTQQQRRTNVDVMEMRIRHEPPQPSRRVTITM